MEVDGKRRVLLYFDIYHNYKTQQTEYEKVKDVSAKEKQLDQKKVGSKKL